MINSGAFWHAFLENFDMINSGAFWSPKTKLTNNFWLMAEMFGGGGGTGAFGGKLPPCLPYR